MHLNVFNFKKIVKRKFIQVWSTIPPISTKWIITSHLHKLKRPQHLKLEIQVLGCDKHKNVTYILILGLWIFSSNNITFIIWRPGSC